MNKQDKELLLKDLSARLPYGVKCYAYQSKIDGNDCECYGTFEGVLYERFYLSDRVSVNGGKTYDNYYLEVKPYLRPMSSMTEEEKKEYCDLQAIFLYSSQYPVTDAYALFDWLNAHHIDFRNLIPMGLALPAPDGMYDF